MKTQISIIIIALGLALTAPVYASEVTGSICTGLSCPIEANVIVAPTASPIAGTYTSAQSVTLVSTGASSIRYTTDGTAPACPTTGTLYSTAISVGTSQTIKAISCYPNSNTSTIASFAYVINIPTSGGGGGGGGGGAIPAIRAIPAVPTVSPAVPATPAVPVGRVLGEATFNFTKKIKLGSKGNDVTELQKRLTSEGFFSGKIDGRFGKITMKALKAFQAKYKLSADGRVGPATLKVLNSSIVVATSTTPGCTSAGQFNTLTGKPCLQ